MIKTAKSGKDWIGLIKNWILFGETEITEQTLDMAFLAYSDSVGELGCGSFLRKEPGKSWQSNRKNLYNTLSDLTLRYGTNGK